MEILKAKKIFFCGIGGIGISALARVINENGISVFGSELKKTNLTTEMEGENIKIIYKQTEENISPDFDFFIYTTAIPENHPELKKAKELKIPTLSYAQALGKLSENFKLIQISGTHGKSTTTAMIAKILLENDLDPTIIIGTLMKELGNKNFRKGNSNIMIIEGCEYKDAFLNYTPQILALTKIEPDHLDYFKTEENYYESFKKMAEKVPENGFIVYDNADKNTYDLIKDSKAKKVAWENKNIAPKVPGKFNIENASLALKVAEILNIEEKSRVRSIKEFSGTWRRMEIKDTNLKGPVFIDDYGHHPTEITLTLKAIREQNPNKKILCIFQPHQYSRTKSYLNEFAKSFEDVDQVIITEIYESRDSDEDKKAISGEILNLEINKKTGNSKFIKTIPEVADYLKNNTKWDVIITMGAGNINEIYDLI
ncbi:MAG: Mur ligase family protein [Candidatus Gracilibacteria bacterium]|jgi:UDP-N-acetylmuramate--alanine ligase|nr:Mur ligase family protein [Candidatus Gracilibacteria bacterium]